MQSEVHLILYRGRRKLLFWHENLLLFPTMSAIKTWCSYQKTSAKCYFGQWICLMDPPGHPDFPSSFEPRIALDGSIRWATPKSPRNMDLLLGLTNPSQRCFAEDVLIIKFWEFDQLVLQETPLPLWTIEGKRQVLEPVRRPGFGTTSFKTRREFGELLRNPPGWSSQLDVLISHQPPI